MPADAFPPESGVEDINFFDKREWPKPLCEASHLSVISVQQGNSRKVSKVYLVIANGIYLGTPRLTFARVWSTIHATNLPWQ